MLASIIMQERSIALARALRQTASRLRTSAAYQWGHFGACNCGHLAQTLTNKTEHEIHHAASERADWAAAALEYCPASGLPVDGIIDEMLSAGLTLTDIRQLEDLSDRRVLSRLPAGRRHLRRNDRAHLLLYLDAWAQMLEENVAPPMEMAAE